MRRTRVVVAGLGDAGLLTAVRLARHADLEVVGISSQPGLVSGQELGLRLADPARWARDYWVGFERFSGLDPVRTVHGVIEACDPQARTLTVRRADGAIGEETYDHLVVATGVRNGFWRTPELRDADAVASSLRAAHERLVASGSVAVVGGGAAAVATAAQLATRSAVRVDLYFPGERALPQHHPRVWSRVAARLERLGVGLHAGHRAELPEHLDRIGEGPVRFTTGQAPAPADAVVWAVGRVEPNTAWAPSAWLDAAGFVVTDAELRVTGAEGVWAIGDVAAPAGDPLRSTARNRADGLLAANIRAAVDGRDPQSYAPEIGRAHV